MSFAQIKYVVDESMLKTEEEGELEEQDVAPTHRPDRSGGEGRSPDLHPELERRESVGEIKEGEAKKFASIPNTT